MYIFILVYEHITKHVHIHTSKINTDVAKEAAAMVIIDNDFSTIVQAIYPLSPTPPNPISLKSYPLYSYCPH
jgi:hypothetical protein